MAPEAFVAVLIVHAQVRAGGGELQVAVSPAGFHFQERGEGLRHADDGVAILDDAALLRLAEVADELVVGSNGRELIEAGAEFFVDGIEAAAHDRLAHIRQRAPKLVIAGEEGIAPLIDVARRRRGDAAVGIGEGIDDALQRIVAELDVGIEMARGKNCAASSPMFSALILLPIGVSMTSIGAFSAPATDLARAAVSSAQPLATTMIWSGRSSLLARSERSVDSMTADSLWAGMMTLKPFIFGGLYRNEPVG